MSKPVMVKAVIGTTASFMQSVAYGWVKRKRYSMEWGACHGAWGTLDASATSVPIIAVAPPTIGNVARM